MTKADVVKFWLEEANKNRQVAKNLIKLKHFSWCLFIWQLVLEQTLKALVANTNTSPPPTHDLANLAKLAKINPSPTQVKQLETITTFNLETRYDDYKHSFYNKATKEYAQKWSKISNQLFLWLKKQL